MEKMSMVLVIMYDGESLCSDDALMNWFKERGCQVNENEIELKDKIIKWNNMRKVNSLIFTIDIENDDEFPSILFEFIGSLKNKDTIISLAEESPSGYQLIFEANLKRFREEIMAEE
jgi:hypothetical protein